MELTGMELTGAVGVAVAAAKVEDRRAPKIYTQLIDLVAKDTGIAAGKIRSHHLAVVGVPRAERDGVARARRLVLYLAVTVFNCSVRSVARASGLSPEGVRKALHAVEDLRDDAHWDAVICNWEKGLAA